MRTTSSLFNIPQDIIGSKESLSSQESTASKIPTRLQGIRFSLKFSSVTDSQGRRDPHHKKKTTLRQRRCGSPLGPNLVHQPSLLPPPAVVQQVAKPASVAQVRTAPACACLRSLGVFNAVFSPPFPSKKNGLFLRSSAICCSFYIKNNTWKILIVRIFMCSHLVVDEYDLPL